jgi:hypothetical protein
MQHNAEQKKTLGERFHTARHFVILGLFIIAIILGQSVFAAGVQTPPTSPATPATFLNISSTNQAKTGWLGLGMLTPAAMPTAVLDVKGTFISDVLGVFGLTSIAEKMKIGVTAPTFGTTDPTLTIEGSRIRSTILSGIGERAICADANGRLVLCGLPPTPTPVDGVCGQLAQVSDGGLGAYLPSVFPYQLIDNPQLCAAGTPVLPVLQSGGEVNPNFANARYTIQNYWTCEGLNGGLSPTCSTQPECPAGYQMTGCFLEGTQVTLADGTKRSIEDVAINEVLLASGDKNNVVEKTLKHRYVGWVYGINGSKPFVTANHPMMTTEGWKSFDAELTRQTEPEVEIAGNLEKGDFLIKEDGSKEEITSYSREWMDTTVYNFTVSGNHTYYANSYAVHNAVNSNQNYCAAIVNNPSPAPDAPTWSPLCAGTAQAPACNSNGVQGALSAVPYNYTLLGRDDCPGNGIFNGYGCTVTYSSQNNLGNNIVQQVNCTDYCAP